jgi:hypothetical protein
LEQAKQALEAELNRWRSVEEREMRNILVIYEFAEELQWVSKIA